MQPHPSVERPARRAEPVRAAALLTAGFLTAVCFAVYLIEAVTRSGNVVMAVVLSAFEVVLLAGMMAVVRRHLP